MPGFGFPSVCSSLSTLLDLYATDISMDSTSRITSVTGPGPTALGSCASFPLLRNGPEKHL